MPARYRLRLVAHLVGNGEEGSDVERAFSEVIGFFLGSGIVPSLSGLALKRRSLPKEEAMPVVSVLQRLLYTTFAMASL